MVEFAYHLGGILAIRNSPFYKGKCQKVGLVCKALYTVFQNTLRQCNSGPYCIWQIELKFYLTILCNLFIYLSSGSLDLSQVKKSFSFCFQVYLHAEESWAETAAHSHWLVKSSWWRPKKLVVEEVMGTKRYVKTFFIPCIPC